MRRSAVVVDDSRGGGPQDDLSGLYKVLATIGSVMRTDVMTLYPEETVGDALALFGERRFRHLLVCEGRRHLVGLVSDRDLLRFLIDHPGAMQTPVGEMMTRRLRTVRASNPLSEAASLMMRNRIHCLPVVDDDGVVEGIITSSDLLGVLHAVQYWVERRMDPSRA